MLRVALREPAGTFRVVTDLGEREDWFTPVDGFVPSLGFGAAVFDHRRFNHAYIAGLLSFKTAPDRAGYALGLERPLFGTPTLYIGAELYDLTATDDSWQVSSFEASLAALAVRKSFRDYYRRRGGQVHAALRVHPRVELLFAWRGERHEPLAVASDFSLWNRDDEFRPNGAATDGRLNALVIGASLDAVGFNLESIASTYRRHLLEMPFGERLNALEGNRTRAVWRLDWASEVSSPDALNSDFDFARHIVGGRLRVPLSSHEELRARAIGGWPSGTLPPQRLFSIGGIGSVHGYEFKEALGDDLALLNVEYAIGRLGGRSASGREITVTAADGGVSTYDSLPNPMPISVPVGSSDRLNAAARYYARAVATLGTIAEREIEEVGDAVFGRSSETNALGSLGRMVFRRMLQISDYLQSVTAEGRGRNMTGQQIIRP